MIHANTWHMDSSSEWQIDSSSEDPALRYPFHEYLTGWPRLIGSPNLQIIFHKRTTKCRSLLRKITYEDKGSYESSAPCFFRVSYTQISDTYILRPYTPHICHPKHHKNVILAPTHRIFATCNTTKTSFCQPTNHMILPPYPPHMLPPYIPHHSTILYTCIGYSDSENPVFRYTLRMFYACSQKSHIKETVFCNRDL